MGNPFVYKVLYQYWEDRCHKAEKLIELLNKRDNPNEIIFPSTKRVKAFKSWQKSVQKTPFNKKTKTP